MTDDGEILEIARKSRSGERLEAFLAGDWQRLQIGDGSQSAADQAFCNLLAFWLNRDPARIDAVFRRSGMMRPKWDERRGARTYGEITIGRAVRDCREVYEQRRRSSAPAAAPPGGDPPGGETPPEDASPGKSEAVDPAAFSWDDTGNAQRFRAWSGGDARYDPIDAQWLIWDGRRWCVDEIGRAKRMADALLAEMRRRMLADEALAGDRRYIRHLAASRSSRGKEAMLREARHLEGIPVLPAELDRPGNVFNAHNCMVSLRTGAVRPHDRGAMLSKLGGTAYEAGARAPRWLQFLDDVAKGDAELKLYLQRMAGYCLTRIDQGTVLFFSLRQRFQRQKHLCQHAAAGDGGVCDRLPARDGDAAG